MLQVPSEVFRAPPKKLQKVKLVTVLGMNLSQVCLIVDMLISNHFGCSSIRMYYYTTHINDTVYLYIYIFNYISVLYYRYCKCWFPLVTCSRHCQAYAQRRCRPPPCLRSGSSANQGQLGPWGNHGNEQSSIYRYLIRCFSSEKLHLKRI